MVLDYASGARYGLSLLRKSQHPLKSSQGSSLRGLGLGGRGVGIRGVHRTFVQLKPTTGIAEVCVSKKAELHRFIVTAWPKRHGSGETLDSWLSKAFMAFPDVDLIGEARRAAMWEEERASNKKRGARRFLTNWWARTPQSFEKDPAPVVSISAARWLKKNSKYPDYLFEKWARGSDINEESVLRFCEYSGASRPDSPAEVVSLFLKEA